jgi:hypothetical protein
LAETIYTYTKSPVDAERLELEVASSAITVALARVTIDAGTDVSIVFKAELSSEEVTILNNIVSAHTGDPMHIDNLVKLDTPMNDEGKPIFVRSMTETDWHYSPHALDYYTSTYKSLYNRTEDGGTIAAGTDCGDAVMRFFDADDNEIMHGGYEEADEEYQARLTASCTKTVIDFEKTTPYDIIGCMLYVESTPDATAYMWVTVAPDIPKEYGGSKSLMGRGMNLKMMGRPMYPHLFFAESCSRIMPDPVYRSGKIRITVKHQPGQAIGLQNLFIMYEE